MAQHRPTAQGKREAESRNLRNHFDLLSSAHLKVHSLSHANDILSQNVASLQDQCTTLVARVATLETELGEAQKATAEAKNATETAWRASDNEKLKRAYDVLYSADQTNGQLHQKIEKLVHIIQHDKDVKSAQKEKLEKEKPLTIFDITVNEPLAMLQHVLTRVRELYSVYTERDVRRDTLAELVADWLPVLAMKKLLQCSQSTVDEARAAVEHRAHQEAATTVIRQEKRKKTYQCMQTDCYDGTK